VSTLGYPLFDEIRRPTAGKDAHLSDAEASGEYTEDGLVVLAESTANLHEVPSAGSWVISNASWHDYSSWK
jgi:hypothetical protein